MSFYTAFILILSVAYIAYIALQLHSDYRKSRPLEGQSEEHFTFNPNASNVNSVKVTMDEDGISLVPEQPLVQPALPDSQNRRDEIVNPQIQPVPQQTISEQVKTDDLSEEPVIDQTVQPTITSVTEVQPVVKTETIDEVIDQLRMSMISIHAQEFMSAEFTSTELLEAAQRGEIYESEVSYDPNYDDNMENNPDNDTPFEEDNSVDEISYSEPSSIEDNVAFKGYDENVFTETDSQETDYSQTDTQEPDYIQTNSVDNGYDEDDYSQYYSYNPDDDIPDMEYMGFPDEDYNDMVSIDDADPYQSLPDYSNNDDYTIEPSLPQAQSLSEVKPGFVTRSKSR